MAKNNFQRCNVHKIFIDDFITHKSLTEEVVDELIILANDYYLNNRYDIFIALMKAGKLTITQIIEDVLCQDYSTKEVIDYLRSNMIDKDYTNQRTDKLKEKYLNNQTIDNLLLISYEFEHQGLMQFVLDNLNKYNDLKDSADIELKNGHIQLKN